MADNKLYYGDNLDVLRKRIDSESVDLVYLDPPFNSNRNYNVLFGKHAVHGASDAAQIQAFGDTWVWTPVTDAQFAELIAGGMVPIRVSDALEAMKKLLGENDAMAYLVNMAPRLVELHRVLKPTGSLYLHCDPTMSHYLKVLLDAIFGPANFRNEIVWKRTSSHNDSLRYASVQDYVLYYGKSSVGTWNLDRDKPLWRQPHQADHISNQAEVWLLTEVPANWQRSPANSSVSGLRPDEDDQYWSAIISTWPRQRITAKHPSLAMARIDHPGGPFLAACSVFPWRGAAEFWPAGDGDTFEERCTKTLDAHAAEICEAR
jgi:DNA modification methylase